MNLLIQVWIIGISIYLIGAIVLFFIIKYSKIYNEGAVYERPKS